jgi:putative ABC transport system permease protein
MIRNYFKIIVRNLAKHKVYTVINIAGLAAGMAVAMLIGLLIWNELTFDHWHEKHDRIVQVMNTQTVNGVASTTELLPIPLAEVLRKDYAGDFKNVALVFLNYTHVLSVGDDKVSQSGVWTTPELPEMLTLKMVSGSRDALKDPSSVLITASVAKALFGSVDVQGKLLKMDNMASFKVGGVFEDLPENTSFYGTKIFLPWAKAGSIMTWLPAEETHWGSHNWRIYAELNDKADVRKASAAVSGVLAQHDQSTNIANSQQLMLHPMNQWHLYSEFTNGIATGGRIAYVWLFAGIGGFVLLLACINFMNLSTARSEKRSREVGIRKAIGSNRTQLAAQFLGESISVSFIALAIALLLVTLGLPAFNELADKQLTLPLNEPLFWAVMVGFMLFTGLLAGSYPAFYLSGFEPVKVLKGAFKAGRWSVLSRKALVVVQFTVSITLIIGTIIVYRQVQHAKDRPVGYTREGLISVNLNTPELYDTPLDVWRQSLTQTGAVTEVSQASISPTEMPFDGKGFEWQGKLPGQDPTFKVMVTTADFGKTLGWEIKDGRDFSRDFATDSNAIVVNEAAEKLLAVNNPIGQEIHWGPEVYHITGVVRNMVMGSPYEPVQPTFFLLAHKTGDMNVMDIRINPAMPIREALAKIEPVFKQYNPSSPFVYHFADDEYAKKFVDEERIGRLVTFFALLAIFISCLGLFGLAAFMSEQRTKEIGVRKVLGATVFNLWGLLSGDFMMLVIIAGVIAMPLAGYFMQRWLQGYTYRTNLSWWVFAAAESGAIIITLITVSFQTIKAALINPVKSLKAE